MGGRQTEKREGGREGAKGKWEKVEPLKMPSLRAGRVDLLGKMADVVDGCLCFYDAISPLFCVVVFCNNPLNERNFIVPFQL